MSGEFNIQKELKDLILNLIHRIFTMNDKENTMATAKTEDFTEIEIEIAEIAKALSHPARIKILKILTDLNSCMVGNIVDLLPLSQSTVSQHLKELKRVNLIHGEVEGPKICYCINPKVMERAKKEFTKLFSQVCNC